VDPVPDPLLLRKSGSAGDRTRDLCICSQKLWPLDHRGGLPTTYICYKSILVQHTIFLYSWQWPVDQQHTQNEFLLFHLNSGYANASQCYVKHTLLILFRFRNTLILSRFAKESHFCLRWIKNVFGRDKWTLSYFLYSHIFLHYSKFSHVRSSPQCLTWSIRSVELHAEWSKRCIVCLFM